jgi:hypothetical protein
MHQIEACGLHEEISNIAIVSPAAPESKASEVDVRRRIFWVSWALNRIISYEYGRSRVYIPGTSVKPFDTTDSPTSSHILVALANSLPEDTHARDNEEAVIQNSLDALNQISIDSEPLILVKADIAFCLYRRLRSLHARASVCARTTTLVISIGISALPTVTSLAKQRLPWWTIISVPFQLVCVLLAIDSRESLSHIAQAMDTLESVGRHWDTHMAREAVGCAGLLVKLSRRRKEEDLRYLERSMPRSSGPYGPVEPSDMAEELSQPTTRAGTSTIAAPPTSSMDSSILDNATIHPAINWADGLDVQIPENLNIDWSEYETYLTRPTCTWLNPDADSSTQSTGFDPIPPSAHKIVSCWITALEIRLQKHDVIRKGGCLCRKMQIAVAPYIHNWFGRRTTERPTD